MSGKKEKKNRFIVLNILVLFVYPFMLSASARQSVCHVRCLLLLLFHSLSCSRPRSVSLAPAPFSVSLAPLRLSLSLSLGPLSRSLSRSLSALPFSVARAETIPLGQFSMHGLPRFFVASTPIFRPTIRRTARRGFCPPRASTDAFVDTRNVEIDS